MNYAATAPPDEFIINGEPYPINTDFMTWIEVQELQRDLLSSAETIEDQVHNLDVVYQMETLVFGGVVEQPVDDVITAMAEFVKGYPAQEPNTPEFDRTPVVNLKIDLNWIILAIRNQSGIDLSYRRTEPFHWWLFLLEFNSLSGDHYILSLMRARGYRGSDKEALSMKYKWALPVALTADMQRAEEEADEIFYNS